MSIDVAPGRLAVTVNGRTSRRTVDARTLLVHLPARARAPHRHPRRLRHLELRGLHRAARRRVGEELHRARRCRPTAPTVTTIEGLTGPYDGFTAVQEGFRQCHGLQCGYCTPGMVMAATGLLADEPGPDDAAIRTGLEGNLCRAPATR